MDRFSVFVPKLLPRDEPSVSKLCSCPGCGQAVATRLIGKAMQDLGRYPYGTPRTGLYAAAFPYRQWQFAAKGKTGSAALKVKGKKVYALAGESGTFDDIFPFLAEAGRKGNRFLYICFFNEAGIERHKTASSSGDYPDSTKSFIQRLADMQRLIDKVRAIKPDFLATACPAYPFDLIEKVKQAADCRGAGFLAVFVPCPTGCFYDPSQSLLSGRLAVETGFFPLYLLEGDRKKETITSGAMLPVTEYMKLQPGFSLISAAETDKVQKAVKKINKQARGSRPLNKKGI